MENCRKILQFGLQALQIPADEQKLELLLSFINLISKWNKAYNLTAIRVPEEMARLHILDSLAVLPYIQGENVADIGTGAGLPGIPLAVFMPDVEFVLVDSNSKKTRFVQQAVLELKLKNVTVIQQRVENMQTDIHFSTVIMRAFAKLDEIIRLTRHLVDAQGIVLAMKGHKPGKELDKMTCPYCIIPVQVPGIVAERCIIEIKGVAENG